MDNEAALENVKPYSKVVSQAVAALNKKYNEEAKFDIKIKIEELGKWLVWDVMDEDCVKGRINHVPFIYEWDLIKFQQNDKVPFVSGREKRNVTIDGKEIEQNKPSKFEGKEGGDYFQFF